MRIASSTIVKMCFVVLWSITATSCATLFSGLKADIFIDGDIDEPVTISSSAATYEDVTLPTVVEVKRRQLNGQHIQISSEHHTFDDIVLEKTLNEWALIGALTYGVPLCIDLLTNAVSKPKYNQFLITPLESIAAADSLDVTLPRSVVPSSALDFTTKNRLRSQRWYEKYPRHEINVTLGIGHHQADHLSKQFVDDILPNYHMEEEVAEECGIYIDTHLTRKIEYHYRLNRKWDVGALLAWGISSDDYTDEYYYMNVQHKDDFPGFYNKGSHESKSFTFAPSIRYSWYEMGACRIYSRAALGIMRDHLTFDMNQWIQNGPTTSYSYKETEKHFEKTKWRMAYQLSPLGMSVGAGPVRLLAELGYGCLGVFNIGLGICF